MLVRTLFDTRPDVAPMIARIMLGAVMLPHGLQHALGRFGGGGFSATLEWMNGSLGFPKWLAAIAIVTELIAPPALILGIGGRIAAVGIAGLMLFALSTHWTNGFFMNWFGKLATGTEGFEYHLLALALAAVVAISGSGAFSLDARLAG